MYSFELYSLCTFYNLFVFPLSFGSLVIFSRIKRNDFLLFCTDDLPMRGFIGHLEESGFLPHSHKVFLWAHLNFNIEFNGDQVFEMKTKLV